MPTTMQWMEASLASLARIARDMADGPGELIPDPFGGRCGAATAVRPERVPLLDQAREDAACAAPTASSC